MGGGLMQLVAYGAQDIYLTGSPQITFFKVVYRRHTNFAIEAIEQVFNGNPTFGQKVTSTISRNGDLINCVYLQVQFPALSVGSVYAPNQTAANSVAWTNSLGHALIRYVDIEIGGQRIDRHYGMWLEIWDELTQTAEKANGYNHMVGKYYTNIGLWHNANSPRIYYVPLQFWFCTNPGLSLPLIALQYHEVKISMEFRSANELIVGLTAGMVRDNAANVTSIYDSGLSLQSAALWVDYVYLDTDERRRFAQMSHEYLIDQLQFNGSEPVVFGSGSSNYKFRLNFNHPVKELVWVLQRNVNVQIGTAYNDWFNFSASGPGTPLPSDAVDLMADAKILLNGHDRFAARPQTYFRLVQPYQCHTRIPSKHIYLYSFGLRPEEHQPSGTCNFSRIDNAQLLMDLTNSTNIPNWASWSSNPGGVVWIFAKNYNVLRIMSGMGGLAYSN
jgi:hypothetical protein